MVEAMPHDHSQKNYSLGYDMVEGIIIIISGKNNLCLTQGRWHNKFLLPTTNGRTLTSDFEAQSINFIFQLGCADQSTTPIDLLAK